jgi:type IV secretory pathway VirB10-like protein
VSIRLTGADPGSSKKAILVTVGCGVVGLALGGVFLWTLLGSGPATAERLPEGSKKLAERSESRRSERAEEAARLRQREIGDDYQFDAEGNLIGARTEVDDVPSNRALAQAVPASATDSRAEIARGIEHRPMTTPEPVREGGEHAGEGTERAAGAAPMLGYSTIRGANWAARRPEVSGEGRPAGQGAPASSDAEERLLGAVERSLQTTPAVGQGDSDASSRSGGGAGVGGEALYPAQRAAQPFRAGQVGDMRIGGRVGADQIVRQGKFLDCVLVNELRVDLVESPVIAMVARDFVSLDGTMVLVPAGAKLLGTAGQVGNLQQLRVYIRFDRIIFPDQRSAFFPTRQLGAVDGAGAVGVEGSIDRHLMLQFGAAIMLGVLDGLAAAVETPGTASNPGVRELVMARTSSNFSSVVAGIIGRYANVVPTVTVEPGSKLKIFFAEDVWLSPYMRTADLSWIRRGTR